MKQACLLMVLAIMVLLTSAPRADTKSIATVTSVHKVITVTLPAPYNETVYAGTFNAVINNVPVNLYCVDISHNLAFNESYQDVSATDSVMTYVLNNYYPFKAYPYTGSLNTVEKEAGAVQIALWHLSDGLDINLCSNVDASVKIRALEILSDAAANAHVFSLNSFFIDIPNQSFNIGSPITFTVKAFDNMGIAMPNVNITLSTGAGSLSTTTVTTGANGVSPSVTLTPTGNMTTANITASGTVGIPAGTKYFHLADPNGKQKLILATPTIASRTISRTISWYNQIQLVVTKKADKSTVNDGDFINYTLTVKNIGAVNAQNVKVSDQLPAVLDYVSCTPSGVFNSGTGIWSAGDLNAGDSTVVVINTKTNYSHSNANPFNFGEAQDFNLFVIDTLIQPSADTQGKLAVGGYASLSGYSVGDQLPPNSGNVLVCGNHLTFMVGRVYNGKALYQEYITSTMSFSADDGIYKDSVVNFAGAKLHLNNLSEQLASLSRTDTVAQSYFALTLNGSKPGLNVFYLDGSKLLNSNGFTINAPAGSSVIVNISGDSTRLFGGFEVNGTTKDKVLLNFYQATKLNISGINVLASVLAPKAKLDFPAGVVTGQLIVRYMYGSGQVNLCQFTGRLTPDTSITNLATMIGANQRNMPSFFNAPVAGRSVVAGLKSTVAGIKYSSFAEVPKEFKLERNYPNPFNPSTVVKFSIPVTTSVKVEVFSVTGELISTLVDQVLTAGTHEVSFDAGNLSSGIYFCQMKAGSFNRIQKMILMK